MKGILNNLIYPQPILLIGFILILFLDLVTGVRKAKNNGEATTSKGLRRTIDKGTTYTTLMLSLIIITNLSNFSVDGFSWVFNISINAVISFCIGIEFKSILENLIEINTIAGQPNFICKNLLIPMHNLLILKFDSYDKK